MNKEKSFSLCSDLGKLKPEKTNIKGVRLKSIKQNLMI